MVFMPKHTVVHCCLFIYVSAGSTCEAKFLHEQLTELGVKPEDSAIATLIVQYGQEQNLHQAEELFESASTLFPVGGPVYNAMVDALCKCGKIEEAYHLFMKMAGQGHSRDVVTISILVTHLTKHGKYFFSTATDPCAVNLVRHFAAAYTHIAKLLPGKFQEAENIIHCCFNGEVELDTVAYNTFIKSMLESGLDKHLFLFIRWVSKIFRARVPWLTATALVSKQANYTQQPKYMIA